MRIRLGLMAFTAAAALVAIPASVSAAVDAFIWFDNVAGPTRDADHRGAFEIKDFSFGVENPTTIGSATGGAGAGKVKFNEFTIKKTVDSASPNFFRQAASTGRHFARVRLQMRKAGGGLANYVFDDVAVKSINWSGPGDEGPEESITFVYGRMSVGYAPQSSPQSVPQSAPNAVDAWRPH